MDDMLEDDPARVLVEMSVEKLGAALIETGADAFDVGHEFMAAGIAALNTALGRTKTAALLRTMADKLDLRSN